ncbi:DEKNAAC101538 [Brettanomyces naardenensis]|uniref:Profilin n=1 Tax=Brettanomyces naardenensis TaxID=13370 RepID=A0A448YII0_BRENA|nr:DEKNAAC101538 [Brettanomyces naardenensis]
MSWNAYTDNLTATGKLDKAAIYGADGASVWATTNGFQLQPSEVQDIATGYGDASKLWSSGLHVEGQKYFCIKADDRSIYGKHEAEGVLCVKTKQAILIAHYPGGVQPGEAAKIVEQLADYLIGQGY